MLSKIPTTNAVFPGRPSGGCAGAVFLLASTGSRGRSFCWRWVGGESSKRSKPGASTHHFREDLVLVGRPREACGTEEDMEQGESQL